MGKSNTPQKGPIDFELAYGSNMHNLSTEYDKEAHYQWQSAQLANHLLIGDQGPTLNTLEVDVIALTGLKFLNKGEVIAGSYVISQVHSMHGGTAYDYEDIDIYFHSKEDAQEFAKLNGWWVKDFIYDKPKEEGKSVCAYAEVNGIKYNLIWGISFKNASELISKFDIRVCSMAFDPSCSKFLLLEGAFSDAVWHRAVFNPVPRNVSMRRLIKYVKKGYEFDNYQRLFFSELVRSDIYSAELELVTGY
jgi:hypothetical protein